MSDENDMDAFVALAIESLYPNNYKPDEHNACTDGSNYKAPDHSIYNGNLLIERKSRNFDVHEKVNEILNGMSKKQNFHIRILSQAALRSVLDKYPDPIAARRRFSDSIHNGILQSLRDANDKFRKYTGLIGRYDQLKVAIISDNSQELISILPAVFFIWRKMGANGNEDNRLPFLDCVIIIRNPMYTLDCKDGYWFQVILRNKISELNKFYAYEFVHLLHGYISNCRQLTKAAFNFKNSMFEVCIVN